MTVSTNVNIIRDEVEHLVREVFNNLSVSDETIELPVTIDFGNGLVFEHQKSKDIVKTVLKGIAEKQILFAVSETVRKTPVEVGYLTPPQTDGKIISAILSPDFSSRVENPFLSIKEAIVEVHALDLMSAASGVKLISHGIQVDRMVYSVNFG